MRWLVCNSSSCRRNINNIRWQPACRRKQASLSKWGWRCHTKWQHVRHYRTGTATIAIGPAAVAAAAAAKETAIATTATSTATIKPGVASHSLVSVVKLCNAGCEVDIRDISCEIRHKGKTIVRCSKCTRTGLWMMPLMNKMELQTQTKSLNPVKNFANHVQQTTSKAELAQFYHQSYFTPPVVTLQKAIKNNQLKSFPGLEQSLLKHLPTSTATLKGHMHKNRKGVQ